MDCLLFHRRIRIPITCSLAVNMYALRVHLCSFIPRFALLVPSPFAFLSSVLWLDFAMSAGLAMGGMQWSAGHISMLESQTWQSQLTRMDNRRSLGWPWLQGRGLVSGGCSCCTFSL